MARLIVSSLRWIKGKFISFIVVLLILSIYVWLQDKANDIRHDEETIRILSESISKSRGELSGLLASKSIDFVKYSEINNKLKVIAQQIITIAERIDVLESGVGKVVIHVPWLEFRDEYRRLVDEKKSLETLLDKYLRERNSLSNERTKRITELEGDIAAQEMQLDVLENRVSEDVFSRALAITRTQVPFAAGILLSIILLPVIIKSILFFVLAPLVRKRPAIQIIGSLSECTQWKASEGRISASTLSLTLSPDQQLLIKPDYIQSSPSSAKKSTKLFINRSIPLSSIATGLVGLTRISADTDLSITVSCQSNPIMELAAIDVVEGDAFVCHPRMLVGAIVKNDGNVKISRHWRLFSLHAWLTLHLRYIVVHGPCTLIMEGARGVRAEVAHQKRIINQSSTLGFSACLHHSNSRCETFYSYFTGKDDLFNDEFYGSDGIFVYEEYPVARRKYGVAGRGLEGVMDAVFKIFGL